MHKAIEEYILKQQNKQREELEKEKADFLISKGLFEKVYSQKEEYDPEFPLSEWDEQTKKYKEYKEVPIEITDEEYQLLLDVTKPASKKKTTNGVATALAVFAWIIFIGGFIGGISAGNQAGSLASYYRNTFSLETAAIVWAVSLVAGLFTLGFSEIIKLLNDIKNK